MKIAFVYMSDTDNVARGAGYIVSALTGAGHDVHYFDTFNTPVKSAAAGIISGDFDILMVSTMTMQFEEAMLLLRMVKSKTNIPTLFGGVHVTVTGKDLLLQNPEIDFLCIGEGINSAITFANNFGSDKLLDTPNIVYRKNGEILANPCGAPDDLSALPPFPWHLFSKESILQSNRSGFTYISATRGCPYNCTFCNNGINLKLYGKQFLRFRPVKDVINEMLYLKKTYAPRLFFFSDEMILFNTDYARELLSAIKNEVDVPYGCMARVEHITPEIADLFAETGCTYAGMGVECGNEEFRRNFLNRHMTNEQIKSAFALLRSRNIYTSSFNIIGFPVEFDDKLTEDTIALTKDIRPDCPQFCIFYPFPGTKLYDYCIENDIIDDEKMSNIKNLREDSVLKGVSLREKRDEIQKMLTLQESPLTVCEEQTEDNVQDQVALTERV